MHRSLRYVLPVLASGIILPCLSLRASADQFGLFTYTDHGTSIEITDYPTTETGSIEIPSAIDGRPVTSIGFRAFEYCNGLTSISIPDSITTIANLAFRRCSGLTSFALPPSVTEISPSTFANCSSLTEVTIPSSVTTIGTAAFYGCTNLGSIAIPSSVTSIDTAAFEYCRALTSITIPSSVTSLGIYVFHGCQSLEEVVLPASLTTIGPSAFHGCVSLTAVVLPSSLSSIDRAAFAGCSSLRSVAIPPSLTSIGSWAFSSCRSLTNITLPDSVTTIGESAFSGCRSLTSFTIPATVTSLGSRPFADCPALTSISVDQDNPNYSSQNGMLYDKTRSILMQCPGGYTGSLAVPATVTTVDSGAFANCGGLTAIDVASSNPNYSSEDGVLYDKVKSTLLRCPGGFTGNFTVPASVSSIASSAFSGCGDLTAVTLPTSITKIESSTFDGCTSLTAMEIPDSVTTIDTRAFRFCVNLQSVDLPASNVSIKDEAFQHCAGLTTISLPAPPLSLGRKVFSDCHLLTGLTIPAGTLTGAGSFRLFDKDFSFCTSLRTISLPPTTSAIPSAAFISCLALESINVDAASTGFKTVDGVLFTADMITLIRCPARFSGTLHLPATVTSIDALAFENCSELVGIQVDPSNPNFSDRSGVLYNKDQTLLIRCPGGYSGSHTVGIQVSSIQGGALASCSSLTAIEVHPDNPGFTSIDGILYNKSLDRLIQVPGGYAGLLSIPDSVVALDSDAVSSCPHLTAFSVGSQNPSFSSLDGILYNKDQTILIACPAPRAGGLVVSPSVRSVAEAAFRDCTNLTSVVLPEGLLNIQAFTFAGCTSLESVVIPESVGEVGVYSFFACTDLTKLIFLGDAPYGSWFWPSPYKRGFPGPSVFRYNDASWKNSGSWQGFPLVSMGPRSGFKDWLTRRGRAHDTEPQLDENGDGVSLLMAYVLNLNPNDQLAASLPQVQVQSDSMSMTFYGSRAGVTYRVEASKNLIDWTDTGVIVSDADANGYRTATLNTGDICGFLRLAVAEE